jgi:cell fate (sporulation/competence/biofilm development) regulator YmcA (YheA/YmcA/DUF963 family)
MSEVIKTIEDGWDCVPELTEAVDLIDEIETYVYEIKRCKRDSELETMVEEMKEKLQEAIDVLETIDTDQEFETTDDEEYY